MATDNVLDRVYAGEDDTEDMEEAVWSKATSPVEYTSRSAIEADRALAEKARQEIAAAKVSPKPKTAPKQPQGIPTPTPAQKTSPSITGEAAKGIPEGYSVRKGDTLSAVAKKHGLSLGQLLKLNPQIKDPDNIFIGDKINLQAPQAQTQAFEMPKGRSLDVNQPVLPLGNTAPPYKMQFGDKPLETVAPEGWALGGLRMGGALAGLLKSPASITPRALQQLNKANVGYAVGGSTMRVNPDRLAAAAKPIVETVKVGNFNVTRRAAEAMGIQALGEVANQTKSKSPERSQREVPGPFDKEANAAESIMGPSDIIPDIVEQSTGSELAGFASSFLSPTQAFKKAAGGVSRITELGKKLGYNIDAAHGTITPEEFEKAGWKFNTESASTSKSKSGNAVLGEGFYFSPRTKRDEYVANWHNYYTEEIGGTIIPTELRLKKPLFYSAEWSASIPPQGKSLAAKTQRELANFIRKSNKPEYKKFLTDEVSVDDMAVENMGHSMKNVLPQEYWRKLDEIISSDISMKTARALAKELLEDYLPKSKFKEQWKDAFNKAKEADDFRIVDAHRDPKNFTALLREAGFDGVIDVPEAQYMVIDPSNIRSPFEGE